MLGTSKPFSVLSYHWEIMRDKTTPNSWFPLFILPLQSCHSPGFTRPIPNRAWRVEPPVRGLWGWKGSLKTQGTVCDHQAPALQVPAKEKVPTQKVPHRNQAWLVLGEAPQVTDSLGPQDPLTTSEEITLGSETTVLVLPGSTRTPCGCAYLLQTCPLAPTPQRRPCLLMSFLRASSKSLFLKL